MEQVKKCTKCGEVKPLGAFHNSSWSLDGRKSACKPCAIASTVKWAKSNRQRANLNKAAWKKRNPEKNKKNNDEFAKNWRLANPEAYRKRVLIQNLKRDKSKHAEEQRKLNARNSKMLTDSYVAKRITHSKFPAALIPPQLIEAKRLHLKLRRKLKELQKHENT